MAEKRPREESVEDEKEERETVIMDRFEEVFKRLDRFGEMLER